MGTTTLGIFVFYRSEFLEELPFIFIEDVGQTKTSDIVIIGPF
jgi:hypothetical protein